ncbi:hypothetical protein J7E63_13030 [Bacillus sp. ISL-75]|uniref:hypothetical protein n=1 Tax=Bacillus sp. ISL-75 TaxID=2819137 RepID=UPI001BE53D3C|nr:hypothetical protein [Bacillus sp. ISL-75]MBT2727863.1 hypothetical protein [Bacillus sp. ISL-75]
MDQLENVKKRNNDFKRLLQTDGLGKVFLRDNWEKINEFLGDCTKLIKAIEQLQEENGAMAEKHAEKDIAMAEFMGIIDQQHQEIKELKNKSRTIRFFEMAEENLKLAQENARLKDRVGV